MLDPVILAQFITAASAANSSAARGDVVKRWSEKTGLSRATLYRYLNKEGVKPTRHSAGGRQRTTDITDAQLEEVVVRIIVPSRRKTGSFIGNYRRYLEMAEIAGIIEPGSITETQLKYYLNQQGMILTDLKRPRPTTHRRSEHINQMHQVDASWCLMTHFDKGPIQFADWQSAADASKLIAMTVESGKKRKYMIWRMGIVDHYSGAFQVRYYQAPGESLEMTLEFLEWAWFPKQERGLILHGIPKILLSDKGPGNVSHSLKNLCHAWGISLRNHQRHHPEAKGQVEQLHSMIADFEFELRFDKPRTIDELNDRCVDWSIRYQTQRMHNRYGKSRFQFWSENAASEHIVIPESKKQFRDAAHSQPVIRTVAHDGTIAYKKGNRKFRLFMAPDMFRNLFGRGKVAVYENPFYAPALMVEHQGEVGLATPIKTDAAGFRADAISVRSGRAAAPDWPEQLRTRSEELGPVQVQTEPLSVADKNQVVNDHPLPATSVRRPLHQVIEVTYELLDAIREVNARVPGLPDHERWRLAQEIKASEKSYLTNAEIESIANRYRKVAVG